MSPALEDVTVCESFGNADWVVAIDVAIWRTTTSSSGSAPHTEADAKLANVFGELPEYDATQ